MKQNQSYVGIDKDKYGGMSDIGKIIRDAWAFGLIPQSETCAGWDSNRLEQLWQQVNNQWARFDFRVANLPTQIRDNYLLIQRLAVEKAKQAGWDAQRELDDD